MSRFRERAGLIFQLGEAYGRLCLRQEQEISRQNDAAVDAAYDEGYTDGARDQGEVWVEIDLDVEDDDDDDDDDDGGDSGPPLRPSGPDCRLN